MDGLKLTRKQYRMIYELEDVDELLWGGQAGGGKSEGLLMFALRRRIECPGSVGLMMRRTFPDLDRSLIRKSFNYYSDFAKWSEAKRKWVFKNGSIQEFGYCESEKDVYQYQSAEYDDIEMDELTHFTEFQVLYMMSRLRPHGDWKTLFRGGTNPGNVGHMFVKARYVDVAREKVYESVDKETGLTRTRYFLPASLDDNTCMTKAQRLEYKSWLTQLPETERKQLMSGDWDYVPGAAFGELNRQDHEFDEDIVTPSYARIIMSYDFGFGKPFSIGWWWIDYDGRMWRFKEWYGWNGQADKGMRLPVSQVAQGILKREDLAGLKDRVNYRVAGHDIFSKTPNVRGGGQGPSVAEIFSEHGVVFNPGDPDRALGKAQVHERLRVPEGELPMMMISRACTNFWRTVPVLAVDDNNIEDVDTDQEDHVYDEVKIACMSRPIKPQMRKPKLSHIEKIIEKIKKPGPRDEFEEIYDY